VTEVEQVAKTRRFIFLDANQDIRAEMSGLTSRDVLSGGETSSDLILSNHLNPRPRPVTIGCKQISNCAGIAEVDQVAILSDEFLTSFLIH
jgi:hypothetical protein